MHQHSFIFDESLKPTCDVKSIKSEMLTINALCVSTQKVTVQAASLKSLQDWEQKHSGI